MDPLKQVSHAKEINLKEILNVIKKRIWIVIITSVFTAIAGGVFSNYYKTPLYQATARVLIVATEDQMATLKALVREPVVMEQVIEDLGLMKSPGGLASQVNFSTIGSSQIATITVTDTDPELPAKIANTTVTAFKTEASKILNFNNIKLLTEATVNSYPVNINTKGTAEKAFVLGLIVGIGLVFFLDSLDETVKSKRDIEEVLELKLLGKISKMKNKNVKKKRNVKIELDLRGETVGIK